MTGIGANALWWSVVELAETQFGVVSLAQVVQLGATPRWVEERLRRGQLRALHRRVYAVGHRALVREGRWLAGALAVPGAALSHRTAGALWRMEVAEGPAVEVSTRGSARCRPGLVAHRTRTLAPADLTHWHGVPVTRPERTLVDLACVLDPPECQRLTDGLAQVRPAALRAAIERAGRPQARRALEGLLEPGPRTRSELERAFLRLVRRHGIPMPAFNARVAGLLVDAVWRAERLVVECDSRRWHGGWAARRDDMARDARLQAAGYRVIRLTWTEIHERPEVGAGRVRALLGR